MTERGRGGYKGRLWKGRKKVLSIEPQKVGLGLPSPKCGCPTRHTSAEYVHVSEWRRPPGSFIWGYSPAGPGAKPQ